MWPLKSSPKQVRILSCNGGGIRGLLAARFLEQLMTQVGSSIQETFHLFAGNSTGSLIGLTQVRPDPKPVNALPALYHDFGPDIFYRSRTWRLRTNWGLRGPKYPDTGLINCTQAVAEDYWLSDAQMDFIVPAYDLAAGRGHWFKSWEAKEDPAKDFRLADVGRSSASAPTYFPAAKVQSRSGADRIFVDGGVFANNPALAAIRAARQLYPKAEETLLVSIGTGVVEYGVKAEGARSWGLLSWLAPLIDILQTVNDRHILSEIDEAMEGQDYYRFDLAVNRRRKGVKLPSIALDLASKANLARLEDLAQIWLRSSASDVEALVAKLKQPKTAAKRLGRGA